VRDVNLNIAHMLSGPIEIQGAEAGDLLCVDILDLGPCQPPQEYGDAPGQGWGYTGIFAKVNGGGFLTDHYPDAYKAIWDFHGQAATSRHIPGVRYTGITHPGLAGTAPSDRLLGEWNRREQMLIDTDPNRVPPLALPPNEDGALAGTASGQDQQRIGREGARTVPGRENGGNMDIKNFTRGSRAYYPVFVPGAKFSVGDLHFSQGDGEISFCGAIEMGGFIDFGFDLIKDGMNKFGVQNTPILMPGRVEPRYTEFLTFTGVSVHESSGENLYMDATVAYRRACLNAIEYLKKFGYSGEQAYLLLGSAPIEGRISGVVDIPNACCSLYLPTGIFDFDIRPTKEAPQTAPRGAAAHTG
jgi:formamidase